MITTTYEVYFETFTLFYLLSSPHTTPVWFIPFYPRQPSGLPLPTSISLNAECWFILLLTPQAVLCKTAITPSLGGDGGYLFFSSLNYRHPSALLCPHFGMQTVPSLCPGPSFLFYLLLLLWGLIFAIVYISSMCRCLSNIKTWAINL